MHFICDSKHNNKEKKITKQFTYKKESSNNEEANKVKSRNEKTAIDTNIYRNSSNNINSFKSTQIKNLRLNSVESFSSKQVSFMNKRKDFRCNTSCKNEANSHITKTKKDKLLILNDQTEMNANKEVVVVKQKINTTNKSLNNKDLNSISVVRIVKKQLK